MGRQEIIADLEAMVNVCDAAFNSKSANLMAAVGGTQRWLFKRQETKGTWPADFLSRYVSVFYVLESYFHCCSLRWRFRGPV